MLSVSLAAPLDLPAPINSTALNFTITQDQLSQDKVEVSTKAWRPNRNKGNKNLAVAKLCEIFKKTQETKPRSVGLQRVSAGIRVVLKLSGGHNDQMSSIKCDKTCDKL
jgi:hypothetical protein